MSTVSGKKRDRIQAGFSEFLKLNSASVFLSANGRDEFINECISIFRDFTTEEDSRFILDDMPMCFRLRQSALVEYQGLLARAATIVATSLSAGSN